MNLVSNVECRAFRKSLVEHIEYVYEAGTILGLNQIQLCEHDKSKWSKFEFYDYAQRFKGDGKNANGFANAWLHHIHNNPHHWQYWIFPDGHTPKDSNVENGVCLMPDEYVVEMIADWMGASKAYTGSWDMTDWLKGHIPKISIHSESAHVLRNALCSFDSKYKFVWDARFKNGT